jgi:hypothetical protein
MFKGRSKLVAPARKESRKETNNAKLKSLLARVSLRPN